ncbi:MAG: hypothetical protein DHS20C11_04930 [Lysobacteraceae bacterium]|nr:MAG: hypothetical protein DHS20C11_04930 [Xanthomonadaceae bacterium]
MRFHLRGSIRLTVTFTLLILSGAASAVTYSYSGNPFTTTPPPYTSSDRITGTFQLALPVAPSKTNVDLTDYLLDFSFTDGIQTRTSDDSTVCSFKVSTDASGNITGWLISLHQKPQPPVNDPIEFLDTTDVVDQGGIGQAGLFACDNVQMGVGGQVFNNPGTWSSDTPPGALAVDYIGAPLDSNVMPPYSGSESIIGSMTLTGPLPPYWPLQQLDPFLIDFAFTDGIQTRVPGNSEPCQFSVATNGAGNIAVWAIALRATPLPPPGDPHQLLDVNTLLDQAGTGPAGATLCEQFFNFTGAQSSTPGSWVDIVDGGPVTTYDYFGRKFITADAPWMVGAELVGSMTLDSPLSANMPMTDIRNGLLEFMFQDGAQFRALDSSSLCNFSVATNANGQIDQWSISLRQFPKPMVGNPQRFMDFSAFMPDQAGIINAGNSSCEQMSVFPALALSDAPGRWGQRGLTIPIPTLSLTALAIFALLVVLMTATIRRKTS